MNDIRYVCKTACQLGGKRYEEGEVLLDGVEPNEFFEKQVFTGYSKATSKSRKNEDDDEAADSSFDEEALKKEVIEAVKADVLKVIEEHKASIDEKIKSLEEAKETNSKDIEALNKAVSEFSSIVDALSDDNAPNLEGSEDEPQKEEAKTASTKKSK